MKFNYLLIFSLIASQIAHAHNSSKANKTENNTTTDFTQEGKAALKAMKLLDSWDIENGKKVEATLKDIREAYPKMHSLATSLGRQMPELRDKADRLKSDLLELSFGYAEIALKSNQLDIADSIYRDLISIFVGDIYSGIRDRAKIGLEDVRIKRQASEKKAEEAKAAVQVPEKKIDVYAELIKLNDLKKKGIITESEFKAQKAKILSQK